MIMTDSKRRKKSEITDQKSRPVSLEKIIEGMEFQSDSVHAYFNKETGDIALVSDESFRALDSGEEEDPVTGEPLDVVREIADGKSYLALPSQFEINEYEIMESFALSQNDQAVSRALLLMLQGSGAFRRFKTYVHELDLAANWYEFRRRAYKQIAIDWCDDNHLAYDL